MDAEQINLISNQIEDLVEQHIDADAIAEEFEKYLRRRDPGTGP